MLSFFILGKRYNNQILLSVAVIIAGVITYAAKGEVDYSYYGLVMTMVRASIFFRTLRAKHVYTWSWIGVYYIC